MRSPGIFAFGFCLALGVMAPGLGTSGLADCNRSYRQLNPTSEFLLGKLQEDQRDR